MHPVVKATGFELAGTVNVTMKLASGVTLPAPTTLADFKAVLTPAPPASGGNTILALTSTDATTYGASFKYLFPGDYTLTFNAPSAVNAFATTPPVPSNVTVTSGQATAASFVLSSAH
jgi:hypothetical protein